MSAKDTLNKIKEALGLSSEETQEKVELATMKLEDGATIEAESFEAGNEVFIITDEDRIALPVGEYVMDNGQVLVVQEEGMIAEVREASQEADEEAELKEEEKMEYASKEELAEVKAAISELKEAIEAMMPKEEKEEMAEEVKEELSSNKEELSEQFTHSPEGKAERKMGYKLESRGRRSTQDVIFEKLFSK